MNYKKFWFILKKNEELKLADSYEEHGLDIEQPLAIAWAIKDLYEKTFQFKKSAKINEFLIKNSD